MKKLLPLLFLLVACGGPAVDDDMKKFMKEFGSRDKIADALKNFGAPDLTTDDIELFDLKSPRVVEADDKDGSRCYTLEAESGLMIRSYVICWLKGQIISITDQGMR